MQGERIFCIIPARGGSKGIPRKNVKILGDMPLIGHTFRAVRESKLINSSLVTSEDDEILSYANKCKFPTLRRPMSLATDEADMPSVIKHALANSKEAISCQYLVLLYPTYPFRTGEIIDTVIQFAVSHHHSNVITMKTSEYPAEWLFDMDDNYELKQSFPDLGVCYRRQICPVRWEMKGVVQVIRMDYIHHLNKHNRSPGMRGYPLTGVPIWRMLDLDTMNDWEMAEYFFDKYVADKNSERSM